MARRAFQNLTAKTTKEKISPKTGGAREAPDKRNMIPMTADTSSDDNGSGSSNKFLKKQSKKKRKESERSRKIRAEDT